MSNSGRHEAVAAAPPPYQNSAIARVVGKKITRRRLISRLNRHLSLTTSVEVIELNGGYFVLTFSEEDYLALERLDQPWSIPYLCIHAISWIPDFRPSQNPIHVVNAWIRLHELPIEKYDDLEEIAKLIGEDFVGIDPVTKSRLICKYARICVSLDLRKPLQSSVRIEGKLQEVEYEGFDWFCVCPSCERVYGYCLCPSSESSPASALGKDQMLDLNSNEFEKSGSSLRIDSPDVLILKQQGKESEKVGSSIGINSPGVLVNAEAAEKQKTIECEKGGSSVRIKSPDVPVKIEAVSKQHGKECVNAGIRIDSPDAPVKIEAVAKQKRKGCENAGSGVRIDSRHVSLSTEAIAKQIRTEYEKAKSPDVPMKSQPLPNFPKQYSTVTIKDPKSKHVVPSVEDQFESAKNTTLVAKHNNQPQPQPSSSATTTSIPSLQPRPSSEENLKFYLAGIKCSTKIKEITNTPFKETIVDGCPIVYTVESNLTSLGITLSEVHTITTMVSNQYQYDIDIVPTSTGGVGSKVVSGSESCSKMLVWKFHGTENAKLKQALKDLIQTHDPSLVLIVGTKISGADAEQAVQELPFDCSYCRKPDGYNGGVWLLLSRENVQVEVNSCSLQQVSASVYFRSETIPANSPLNVGTKTSLGPWGPTFFCTPMSWMSSEAC